MTEARPWEAEGVCRDTHFRRLRRARLAAGGAPRPRGGIVRADSALQTKPWLTADPPISRRTFYRHKALAAKNLQTTGPHLTAPWALIAPTGANNAPQRSATVLEPPELDREPTKETP